MGWWQVGADTLAGSSFVVSPLAETTAALLALANGTAAHPGERAWLGSHLPAYRGRLAADPVTAALVRALLGRDWIADFLTPTPGGDGLSLRDPAFAHELAPVRETPSEVARADLSVSLRGPLPAILDGRSDLPQRAADLLEWVWTQTVRPTWQRRRRVAEADVLARTGQLGRGGWARALDGMGGNVRWLGRGRLQINSHDNPPRRIAGARLLFVPVTPSRGWVAWTPSPAVGAGATQPRYAVMYPCSGVLAEPDRASAPESLGRLLGPARAGIMVLLDSPKSTTQLVALTGQGLGSVGRHLRVLLDAGLIRRRRAGRWVLYYRAPAGDTLIEAQRDNR